MFKFSNEVEDHVEACVQNWHMYLSFWLSFFQSTHGKSLVLIEFLCPIATFINMPLQLLDWTLKMNIYKHSS